MAVVKSPKNIGKKSKWVKNLALNIKNKSNATFTSENIDGVRHNIPFSWKKRKATKSKLKKEASGFLFVLIT